MSTEDKPFVRIRKRRDREQAEAEGDETNAEATDADAAADAPTAKDAEAGAADPSAAAAKPAPGDASATTAEPTPKAPTAARPPNAPAPTPRKASGPGDAGSKRGKVWRSDAVPQPGTPREEAPAPIEQDTGPMPTTDDFAAMLGETPVEVVEYEPGDKVRAEVVGMGEGVVFVALGGKSEGVIDSSELLDDNDEISVAPGDTIEAWVTSLRGGTAHLSMALGRDDGGGEVLAQAARDQIPVEGRVTGTNKGGYDVEVMGKRAFCPFSQMDIHPGEPETYVGQTLRFFVQRVSEDARDVVVSRAALLRAERDEKAAETLAELAVDDVLEGTVVRLMDFGAFVDIGGVEGLVHVSELSWGRVDHPRELVSEGDTVRVRVLRIENADDPRGRRIALSMRALQEDPFAATVANLHVGDAVNGVVSRLESFGAFVELAPGVDGLVHISEVAQGRRINHPREVLNVGDDVQVQVLSIDPLKKQIGLSIKALMDDPWSAAASRLKAGTTVQGTVDALKPFGVFVALEGGLSGLLPMSQLPDDEQKNALTRFRPGNAIECRVLDVDPARRRLTLTRRTDDAMEQRQAYAAYKSSAEGEGGLGTLADLLKKRGS